MAPDEPVFKTAFDNLYVLMPGPLTHSTARLAQSVERQPFKLVVVGSSPTVGDFSFYVNTPILKLSAHIELNLKSFSQ